MTTRILAALVVVGAALGALDYPIGRLILAAALIFGIALVIHAATRIGYLYLRRAHLARIIGKSRR